MTVEQLLDILALFDEDGKLVPERVAEHSYYKDAVHELGCLLLGLDVHGSPKILRSVSAKASPFDLGNPGWDTRWPLGYKSWEYRLARAIVLAQIINETKEK